MWWQQFINKITYEKDALGISGLRKNQLRLSQMDIILTIDCTKGEIIEVNILPKNNHFLIKVAYKTHVTHYC